jgi:hypothetical protein
MSVPNTFNLATGVIPLSQLDANFAYYDAAFQISAGNIGFGTSSPSSLKVTIEGNGSQLRLRNTTVRYRSDLAVNPSGAVSWNSFDDVGNTYMPIGIDASSVVFNTGAASTTTERVCIDSAGNVGIGATSPTQKLDVLSTANSANTIAIRNTNTTTATYATQSYLRLEVAGNHIGGLKATAKNLGGLSTPSLYLTTAGAYPIAFGLNDSSTPAMVLDTGGNLTVTAVNTDGNLTVNSNAAAYSTKLTLQAAAGGGSVINATGATADSLRFQITGSEKMRIDSTGNVGIGDTAPASNTYFSKLSVVANNISGNAMSIANASSLRIQCNAFNEATIGAFYLNHDGGGNASLVSTRSTSSMLFGTANTERMRLDSTGNLQVSTGAVVVWAPAPAAISAATTLTNANIQAQIISTTGSTYTVTMPLGTTLESLITWPIANLGYDFYVVNTASGIITMAGNTGVTTLGSLTVGIGASAHFRIRRTSPANNFVLYRLS